MLAKYAAVFATMPMSDINMNTHISYIDAKITEAAYHGKDRVSVSVIELEFDSKLPNSKGIVSELTDYYAREGYQVNCFYNNEGKVYSFEISWREQINEMAEELGVTEEEK